MKIKVSLLTVVFMIAAAITCAASASEGLISENTDYGGDWQVNGTTYVCKERIKWPDFGFYSLGNTSEKLRLYMELTVSDKKSEPDELGGDSGFLVGVTDVNGNGVIEEGSDEYYLIDVASSTDGGFIGIEKNVGKWGDWAAIDRSTGFRAGDKVGLWLIYDPENAHFEIYISDIAEDGSVMTEIEPFLEWTDKSDPNAVHEAGLLNLDIRKAKRILGWRPRWNFQDTVRNTVEWYSDVGAGKDPILTTQRQIRGYDS